MRGQGTGRDFAESFEDLAKIVLINLSVYAANVDTMVIVSVVVDFINH